MRGNNGFSDFTAAASENVELFCLSIVISLCLHMIPSSFSLELNVENFDFFPHWRRSLAIDLGSGSPVPLPPWSSDPLSSAEG